jgi:hypothetical protein
MPKREAARDRAREIVADIAADTQPSQTDLSRRRAQPEGRRSIIVRANPDTWTDLELLATKNHCTLQDLMIEATNDLLVKHGNKPIA